MKIIPTDPSVSTTAIPVAEHIVDTCSVAINQIGVQSSSPITFSSDGKRFCYVNGTNDVVVTLRNEQGLYEIERAMVGHTASVKEMEYHPSKPLVASCGQDGIFIWNADDGSVVRKITEETDKNAHDGEVECMQWLYDGTVLATGGKDATIHFWYTEKNFSHLETLSAHKSAVLTLQACKDRDYLVSAGRDSSINIWRTGTLRPGVIERRFSEKGIVCTMQATMDGHLGDVVSLAVSSTGVNIFSGARDNTVRVWDEKNHKLVREVKDSSYLKSRHEADVTNLYCINNDQYVLSASFDGTIKVFQLGSLEVDTEMDGDISMISMDELLRGFIDEGEKKSEINDKHICTNRIFEHSGVYNLSINPAFPVLAASSTFNTIKIFDMSKGIVAPTLIQEFMSHSNTVNKVLLNASGNILTASDDYMVGVYNAATSDHIRSFNAGSAMYTCAWLNSFVFSAGRDYEIHTYALEHERFYSNVENSYQLQRIAPPDNVYDIFNFKGHSGKIRAIAVSKDLNLLFSCGDDGTVQIFDIPDFFVVDANANEATVPPSAVAVAQIRDHHGIVLALAVSGTVDNEVYMASGGSDYAVMVYSVGKQGRVAPVWNNQHAHDGVVTSACFGNGPHATLLFTGGWDFNINVWDAATGELVHVIKGHQARLTDLVCSPDGSMLLSASADKHLYLWDLNDGYTMMASYESKDVCMTVAFESDKTFIAGYSTGVIRKWALPNNTEYASRFQKKAITV